jgi:hypothetical protein
LLHHCCLQDRYRLPDAICRTYSQLGFLSGSPSAMSGAWGSMGRRHVLSPIWL